jgi:hypothetical protein
MSKAIRKIIESGLRNLLTSFNEDPFFIAANISFSKNFDHFVDRIFERKIDEVNMLKLLKAVVNKNKCQLVYCCNLEDPPLRVNFKNQDMVIGMTLHVDDEGIKRLRLRTIVENFATRMDSRISTFVIME